jgi:prolyl oligopeptidase
LRTSSSAGHGQGTALSERIKQLADIYSFLFAQLDMSPKGMIKANDERRASPRDS